jgi:hypothetical protein
VTGGSEKKVVWIERPDGDPVAIPDPYGWKDATWAGLQDPTFLVYPPLPGPTPPPDDLGSRQAQYDADAVAILGPRPG